MSNEPEPRLWEISEHVQERPVAPVGDDALRRYREGGLGDAERRRIEWAIAHDAATRRRLIALGGLADDTGGTLRERVLGLDSGARRRRAGFRVAAAAVLALGVVLPALLLRDRGAGGQLGAPAFDVRVVGLADVRSADPAAVRALPDTWLEIVVEPRGGASDQLAYALYRRDGEHLERVSGARDVELEVDRGAARFRARAGALVPSSPGVHAFWIAVGTRELPSRAAGIAELERAARTREQEVRMEGGAP
jgi:hypothetical protein